MKLFILTITLVLLVLPSFAQGAGAEEAKILAGVLSGNIGLFIGLSASLYGLYMWLIQQRAWGLVVLILGATFTAFPGIFKGISAGGAPIIQQSGSSSLKQANW